MNADHRSSPVVNGTGLSASPAAQLALVGEIDISNVRDVWDRITAVVHRHGQCVVVDLSGLTFIDVAGMRTIAAAEEWCHARGRALRLVNVPRPIRRTMTLAGYGALVG